MSSPSFSDLLYRFESLCTQGTQADKQISMSKEEAARFSHIFEESLRGENACNQDLILARDVCNQIASGRTVVLYDHATMTLSRKTLNLFKWAISMGYQTYVDRNVIQGNDWIRRAADLARKTRLMEAEKYIVDSKNAADVTTIAAFKEAAARKYVSLGLYEKAFELRTQIAEITFPPDHCLADMEKALVKGSEGKPLSRMGAYFQGLDTGSLKMGTMHASKRRLVGKSSDSAEVPKESFCFDFHLTHWVRQELEKTVQLIETHREALQKIIGHEIRILPETSIVIPAYIEEKDVYARDQGYEGCRGMEIEIIGVGKICINTNSKIHSLYNRVEIILDAAKNQRMEGLKNLHAILSSLGLGTILFPSRQEDEERMKIFILLHTFFPKLAYDMERDQKNYDISVEELQKKIFAKEPNAESVLKKYLDTNRELFVKEELYSGRTTYMIKDMGEQIREHSCGLLFGTKSLECESLSWSKDQAAAQETFKKIAASYAEKLRSGVAMESNREDWLCRGEINVGSSPGSDMKVGGFDSVFTRLIPKAYADKLDLDHTVFCHDGIRVLLDSDVMGSASCYAHLTDRYGTRSNSYYSDRSSLPEFARTLERIILEGCTCTLNEVMIRDLVSTKFIRALLVKQQKMKEILVEEMQKAGLIEKRDGVECVILPGCVKPVDEFIYVGHVCQEKMWTKPTR